MLGFATRMKKGKNETGEKHTADGLATWVRVVACKNHYQDTDLCLRCGSLQITFNFQLESTLIHETNVFPSYWCWRYVKKMSSLWLVTRVFIFIQENLPIAPAANSKSWTKSYLEAWRRLLLFKRYFNFSNNTTCTPVAPLFAKCCDLEETTWKHVERNHLWNRQNVYMREAKKWPPGDLNLQLNDS